MLRSLLSDHILIFIGNSNRKYDIEKSSRRKIDVVTMMSNKNEAQRRSYRTCQIPVHHEPTIGNPGCAKENYLDITLKKENYFLSDPLLFVSCS